MSIHQKSYKITFRRNSLVRGPFLRSCLGNYTCKVHVDCCLCKNNNFKCDISNGVKGCEGRRETMLYMVYVSLFNYNSSVIK